MLIHESGNGKKNLSPPNKEIEKHGQNGNYSAYIHQGRRLHAKKEIMLGHSSVEAINYRSITIKYKME
jgi:hypothetical protein